MIETNYHILPSELFAELSSEAKELDLNLDYYLMEFCDIEGEWVQCD